MRLVWIIIPLVLIGIVEVQESFEEEPDPRVCGDRLCSEIQNSNEEKTIGSRSPIIISQENNVYLIWEENTHGKYSFDLFFRKSNDYGKTFDEIINLTDGKSDLLLRSYQIQSLEHNVYVAWLDLNSETQKRDIYFKKSNDFGESFGDTIRLTPVNNTNYSYNELKLRHSENNVTIFMKKFDIQAQYPSWVLRQSTDFGKSFGIEERKPVFVENWVSSQNKTGALTFAINEIKENDLFFLNYVDSESTTNKKTKINSISTNVTHIFGPQYAQILYDNGNTTYVNWIEESHLDTGQAFHYLLRKSIDKGNAFGDILYPFENTVNFIFHITAKMNQDNLFLLRPDFKNPPYNDIGLYFTKITQDTVKTQEIPNPVQYTVMKPQFVVSGNNIYIVGESYLQKHCIYFASSRDNGITFGNITNVNDSEKGKTCTGDSSDDKYNIPPLKQLKAGIPVEEIRCRGDLIDHFSYVLKANDDSPACVNQKSVSELLKRGWIDKTTDEIFGKLTLEE